MMHGLATRSRLPLLGSSEETVLRYRKGRFQRRSRAKLWNASPHSMRSRRRSVAKAQVSAAPCARKRANHSCWRSKTGSNSSSARLDEVRHCRSHPLRLEPLDGLVRSSTTAASNSTPTLWKKYTSDCPQSEKRAVRRPRSRGGELGSHRLTCRDLQTVWRRSAGLLRRHAHKARQSLASLAPRRAHAMGMGSTAFRRSPRGLITSATRVRARSTEKIKPSEQWIGESLTLKLLRDQNKGLLAPIANARQLSWPRLSIELRAKIQFSWLELTNRPVDLKDSEPCQCANETGEGASPDEKIACGERGPV